MNSLGFDSFLDYPDEVLNIFTMTDATWQTMPTGTWYWTVLAKNKAGEYITPNFTLFSFEVE